MLSQEDPKSELVPITDLDLKMIATIKIKNKRFWIFRQQTLNWVWQQRKKKGIPLKGTRYYAWWYGKRFSRLLAKKKFRGFSTKMPQHDILINLLNTVERKPANVSFHFKRIQSRSHTLIIPEHKAKVLKTEALRTKQSYMLAMNKMDQYKWIYERFCYPRNGNC